MAKTQTKPHHDNRTFSQGHNALKMTIIHSEGATVKSRINVTVAPPKQLTANLGIKTLGKSPIVQIQKRQQDLKLLNSLLKDPFPAASSPLHSVACHLAEAALECEVAAGCKSSSILCKLVEELIL